MTNLRFLFPCCLLLFFSCTDNTANEKLIEAEKLLAEKTAEMETVQQQLLALQSPPGELMHLVFFQLKTGYTDQDVEKLSTLLKSLDAVKSANSVRVGMPTETNDPRAKKDYQVALLVTFDKVEKLATYQKDTFHLEVRKKAGPYLAGPPVVYDFTVN